jgi:hypothetical protein
MSIHYLKYESECNEEGRCSLALWAPSTKPHFTEDRAFSLYAMEESTQQELDMVVYALTHTEGIDIDEYEFECEREVFTEEEIDYIYQEVKKKRASWEEI